MQILVVAGIFFLAFSLFALALTFSKYKQRPQSGCCGGSHCGTDRSAEHLHSGESACCKEA